MLCIGACTHVLLAMMVIISTNDGISQYLDGVDAETEKGKCASSHAASRNNHHVVHYRRSDVHLLSWSTIEENAHVGWHH